MALEGLPSVTLRVCATPGCPTLIEAGRTRCRSCERERDQRRGRRQARGYDNEYDQLGREYERRMAAGERFTCWRCGGPLGTRRGMDWHLGHCDDDRALVHGPEHPAENLATSGRTGCTHASHTHSTTRIEGWG